MTSGRRALLAWQKRSLLKWQELATELNITAAYMSQIKTGVRRPSMAVMMRIEARTGVPLRSWLEISVSDLEAA